MCKIKISLQRYGFFTIAFTANDTKKYRKCNYSTSDCNYYLLMSFFFCNFASNFKPHARSVKSERIYNSQLRQLHFIEAVNKLWKKTLSKHPNVKRICEIASSSPAPKFYISPKRALSKYYEWKQTGSIKNVTELTNSMYELIFERYEEALKLNNGTDFKYSIMQDVLDSPAPSFYISPYSAYNFYCRSIRHKRALAKK